MSNNPSGTKVREGEEGGAPGFGADIHTAIVEDPTPERVNVS